MLDYKRYMLLESVSLTDEYTMYLLDAEMFKDILKKLILELYEGQNVRLRSLVRFNYMKVKHDGKYTRIEFEDVEDDDANDEDLVLMSMFFRLDDLGNVDVRYYYDYMDCYDNPRVIDCEYDDYTVRAGESSESRRDLKRYNITSKTFLELIDILEKEVARIYDLAVDVKRYYK